MMHKVAPIIGGSLLLAACSTAHPVLYPNAHMQSVGKEIAAQDIEACRQLAEAAGAEEGSGKAGRGGGRELTAAEQLEQLEEAAKTAQIGIIDMEELAQFAEPGQMEQLDQLQRQIQEFLRQMAEQQGLEEGKRGGFQMTPKAYRLFQSKLLTRIFEQLQESRSG